MSEQSFFNSTLPPTQEFGFFGRIRNAILGTGRGKFSPSIYTLSTAQARTFLVDTSPGELMSVAMSVPHLNTVLCTGAEYFSLVEIKHIGKDGKEIEASEVLSFLKQPNPLQTLSQYLYEFYIHNGVYNKTFQHMVFGLSFDKIPSALWLLPPGWMKVNTTGLRYRQTKIEEIIESFEMMEGNQKFEVQKIIYMSEGVGNDMLNPISRIEALTIPLSNIIATLKSRNTIITERGMIGFISPKAIKDSDGGMPYTDSIHKSVREEYQRSYSLDSNSGHIAFPKTSLEWTPMTFNVQQLGLIEGQDEDFNTIIAAYRHDRSLYPQAKGSSLTTGGEKSEGVKNTINNGLQPLANKLVEQLTKHLIDPASGEKLIASYKHLPAMQEDEVRGAQSRLLQTQTSSIQIKDGVISHEQYAEINKVKNDGVKIIPKPNEEAKLTE